MCLKSLEPEQTDLDSSVCSATFTCVNFRKIFNSLRFIFFSVKWGKELQILKMKGKINEVIYVKHFSQYLM